MKRPLVAVALWTFCIVVATLMRVAIAQYFDVWQDGRMTIEPWLFACLQIFPIWFAASLFLWYVYTFPANGERDA